MSELSAKPERGIWSLRRRCHAAPVRHARLPSASAWSPPRNAGLRSASLRSIRAAHDGSALPSTTLQCIPGSMVVWMSV